MLKFIKKLSLNHFFNKNMLKHKCKTKCTINNDLMLGLKLF